MILLSRILATISLCLMTCALQAAAAPTALPSPSNPVRRFDVRTYGAKADGANDAPAFQKAISDAIQAGPGAVVWVPAGRYSLQTRMGGGMIEIRQAADLTFQGEPGATLIASDPTAHIVRILNSTNVTVRGFEMDRNPLVFTQGRIVAMDMTAKTVQVTIDAGYDEPDAKYLARLKSFLVFTDPQADTWDQSRWWPKIVVRERLAPMKWRFTLSLAPLSAYAGKRWLLWDNTYKGWGVVVNDSRDCLVEDCRYYGGGADAGIGVWGCTGTITYRHFRVGVPEGSDRLFAAAGGGQEFENRGTLVMDGCDISRVDDDGCNMGTTYAQVLRQINARTIVAERKGIRFQTGDTIALWDWFLKSQRNEAKLVEFTPEDDRSVRLTLDTEVQVLHPVGRPGLPERGSWKGGGRFEEFDGIDRIADFQTAGRMVIKNCRFQNMRARCILVKTSDSLIESNIFYNTHMTAILAGPEFYWGEAPAVRNLVIRGNRFIDIDGSSINLGCHRSTNSYDNRNILIEGNIFENYGALGGVGISGIQGTAVLIRNADGVVIQHNKFGPPAPTAPQDARPLVIEVSRHVRVTDNEGLANQVR